MGSRRWAIVGLVVVVLLLAISAVVYAATLAGPGPQPGRFQIVTAEALQFIAGKQASTDRVPKVFLLDTSTGKVWEWASITTIAENEVTVMQGWVRFHQDEIGDDIPYKQTLGKNERQGAVPGR